MQHTALISARLMELVVFVAHHTLLSDVVGPRGAPGRAVVIRPQHQAEKRGGSSRSRTLSRSSRHWLRTIRRLPNRFSQTPSYPACFSAAIVQSFPSTAPSLEGQPQARRCHDNVPVHFHSIGQSDRVGNRDRNGAVRRGEAMLAAARGSSSQQHEGSKSNRCWMPARHNGLVSSERAGVGGGLEHIRTRCRPARRSGP